MGSNFLSFTSISFDFVRHFLYPSKISAEKCLQRGDWDWCQCAVIKPRHLFQYPPLPLCHCWLLFGWAGLGLGGHWDRFGKYWELEIRSSYLLQADKWSGQTMFVTRSYNDIHTAADTRHTNIGSYLEKYYNCRHQLKLKCQTVKFSRSNLHIWTFKFYDRTHDYAQCSRILPEFEYFTHIKYEIKPVNYFQPICICKSESEHWQSYFVTESQSRAAQADRNWELGNKLVKQWPSSEDRYNSAGYDTINLRRVPN